MRTRWRRFWITHQRLLAVLSLSLTLLLLWSDAQLIRQIVAYQRGTVALRGGDWLDARSAFRAAGSYADGPSLLKETFYQPALGAIQHGDWATAATEIVGLEALDPAYRDLPNLLATSPTLAAAVEHRRTQAWHTGQIGFTGFLPVQASVQSL